jgi:hypothetical protein
MTTATGAGWMSLVAPAIGIISDDRVGRFAFACEHGQDPIHGPKPAIMVRCTHRPTPNLLLGTAMIESEPELGRVLFGALHGV